LATAAAAATEVTGLAPAPAKPFGALPAASENCQQHTKQHGWHVSTKADLKICSNWHGRNRLFASFNTLQDRSEMDTCMRKT